MERVVDVVATRERIKAGVEVLATSCRTSDLSAAFNQFRCTTMCHMYMGT